MGDRRRLTVLRTGAGSLPSPPVLTALREAGCRVVAADANPLAVGFAFADVAATIPRADDPDFTDGFMRVCAEHGVDVVLPAVNEEITALQATPDRLEAAGITLVAPPPAAVEVCLDKLAMWERLAELGIPTPSTVDPRQGVPPSWPAVLKPRRGRGSRGVAFVRDIEELRFHLARRDDDVVLQEHLRGEEYSCDVLADGSGNLRMVAVRRRLQVNAGISVAGELVPSAPFLPLLERLTAELPLPGPSCIQCFRDGDGEPSFTDINPRLGGGVALALSAGTPIVQGIVDLVRGETIPRVIDAGVGARFLRYYGEVYLAPGEGDRGRWAAVDASPRLR